MKKLISCVLALVLMLSLVPSAFAAESKPQVSLSSANVVVNGISTDEMNIKYWMYEKGKGNVTHYLTPKLEVYNINGNNYFKLRDIAMLLSNTDSGFSVDYQWGYIWIGYGRYEYVGGECQNDGVDRSAMAVKSSCTINPKREDGVGFVGGYTPEMYNIGGNNFIKLRDLISYLPKVSVDWDSSTNSIVITTIEKQGTIEDQKAYVRECIRLRWKDDAIYNGAVAMYNELLNSGKINHSMSVNELETAFNQRLYQIPNKGITYGGFKSEDIFEGAASIFVDGYALSNVSYKFGLEILMYLEYAETLREDVKAVASVDWSNYAYAYAKESGLTR